MKTGRSTRLLWAAAVVSVLLGASLAIKAEREIRVQRARLAQVNADLAGLRAMEADIAGYLDARGSFEELGDLKTANLEEILSSALPGVSAEDVRDTYDELDAGWGIRRKELSLKSVPLAGVMAFVQEAERCRPPWRLAKCSIRGGSSSGLGNVSLLFEVVEKP